MSALDEWAKENKKQSVSIEDMGDVVREMKLPHYWKEPLFRACGGNKGTSIYQGPLDCAIFGFYSLCYGF